jgi:tRNA A37 methylthiotransferase MiaB
MKKISFVQVNFQQGPTNLESYYLPYSVGCIWSYCQSFETIRHNYRLDHVIWKRENFGLVAEKLCDQDVIGFSCYVWNRNYNHALARRIKQLNPHCFIFFGGPEPAHTDPAVFEKYPFIDAIVLQEGELTVKNLLENIDSVATVPGMMINQRNRAVSTGPADRIQDLSVLPSPYLSGFFDQILNSSSGVKEWASTLETNRGCPYQCTFCDWGSLTYSRVRQFPLEKVLAEIEWMGQKGIHLMAIADANFGMFLERDHIIVDKYLEMQDTFGFPESYIASFAKNQKKEVLDIVTKLIHKQPKKKNRGLLISLQSLDEDVLTVIKRKNLNQHKCEEILLEAHKRDIVIGTELILGLPSDTLDKWKNNYWKLFDLGMHENIVFFNSHVLENSEMNQTQKEIYGLKTSDVSDYFSSMECVNEPEECKESVRIVTAHNSMPYDDWVSAYTFSWFLNTFHMGGLSEFYSRFLHAHLGITYQSFYQELYQYLEADQWFCDQVNELRFFLDTWTTRGRIDHEICQVPISGANLPWITTMKIHTDPAQKQHVFDLVDGFITRYQLDQDLYDDLSLLQHNRLVDMYSKNGYPLIRNFSFNIYDFLINQAPLVKHGVDLEFSFPEKTNMPDQEFLEQLYFGRNRRFGKTWISQISTDTVR